ncbi:MAG: zinc-binding alcohol dehydrogenase [Planctomycetes bacterium]|nr:zinc-binding alcohol dehydrogenase [Planctomycetota bacterium]
MKAAAIAHVGINQVELRPTEVPDPMDDQVLIQTEYSCISPGTELRCLRGKQDGAAPFPFVPGYSLTGKVIKAGRTSAIKEGRRVFCKGTKAAQGLELQWGGHISHALAASASVIPLPDGVDPLDASIASLGSIAYHGFRVSQPTVGLQVAVVGLGPIGQLAARIHSAGGATVVACDLSESRIELSRRAGITTINSGKDMRESYRPYFPQGADLVIDATGSPAVLRQSVLLARDLPWDDEPHTPARLLIQGSYELDFAVKYHDAFFKELSIILPRASQQRDGLAFLNLLAQKKLQAADLISKVVEPASAPQVYEQLRDPKTTIMTAAFKW